MPFTEHLRELRNRLVVALITVGVIALAAFWPSQYAIVWLKNEYLGASLQLHAFAPTDVIFTELKFSLYAAVVLGMPVIVYQAWMFIVPAFHPRTRNLVYVYVAPSLFLGLAGIAFAHFIVLPRVTRALLAITNQVAEQTFGIESTMNLILILLLAFAVIFQTPVVMVLLARIGLINVPLLRKYRRYAAMGILLLGGFTAPDASPITMFMLAGPMYVLYEASIWIILILERSWKKEALSS